MRTFVIADIHGAHQALLKCLELSKFDKTQDRLICLGDVCDRGAQVRECIDELITIPKCIYILGNHDAWSLEWATSGKAPDGWLSEGGSATVASYQTTGMPQEHIQFLTRASLWFMEGNRLFVHGGFNPEYPLEETSKDTLLWDRTLIMKAKELNVSNPDWKIGYFDEIYLGHTPTIKFGKDTPQKFCNVWAMDTGAGHGRKLTIMDVDTKEFWQAVC